MRKCLRCDKKIVGMGVYAFIRNSLEFRRVNGVLLCVSCGRNGKNVLTDDEINHLKGEATK